MDFESPAQRALYEKTLKWLRGVSYRVERDPLRPRLQVRAGSSVVRLDFRPWGQDDATLRIRALVVRGVEPDLELATWLLRENAQLLFGGFGIDERGDIVFEHSLVGSTCDLDELIAALAAVSMAADEYDNRIVERWGGQRAVDAID